MEILGTLLLFIMIVTATALATLKLGSIISVRITKDCEDTVENILVVAWGLSTVLSAIASTISILDKITK